MAVATEQQLEAPGETPWRVKEAGGMIGVLMKGVMVRRGADGADHRRQLGQGRRALSDRLPMRQ